MEKSVSKVPEFRQYYLSEFEFFDCDEFITFNIVGINVTRNTIAIAISDRGKISIIDFELMADKDCTSNTAARSKKSISMTSRRYDYETYIS